MLFYRYGTELFDRSNGTRFNSAIRCSDLVRMDLYHTLRDRLHRRDHRQSARHYCHSTESKHEVDNRTNLREHASPLIVSRTVTNMFIMNLAAADLLVLVFCLPATVIQDVTKTWFFGLILCKFVNYIQVGCFHSIDGSFGSSFPRMVLSCLDERKLIRTTCSIPVDSSFL